MIQPYRDVAVGKNSFDDERFSGYLSDTFTFVFSARVVRGLVSGVHQGVC